ncbi:hypothetical protein P153DRAFT_386384 [Dothidotthia symphoricarpi CBS 119687]|uniref:Uncharacterized protein n=1 Tax=Dothidotthia symphoricarpi CBS 119687 TaxID=1392245 RepID=A0A6A6ABM6_9PLEO|nr:uncharacterized protein P153DRAFT_386384 [Dothidotthia symphoricarpi CBS 119687]KAF2128257.1 hypothetical protein P153DRAFT_386384 [Dothidotthia symphoricarpi CBS 119687]
MPVDGERWLFDRVGRDAVTRERFMKPGTRSGIDRKAVKRYIDRIVKFQEKPIVLIYITGRQLARATEILSVRYSYTVKADITANL